MDTTLGQLFPTFFTFCFLLPKLSRSTVLTTSYPSGCATFLSISLLCFLPGSSLLLVLPPDSLPAFGQKPARLMLLLGWKKGSWSGGTDSDISFQFAEAAGSIPDIFKGPSNMAGRHRSAQWPMCLLPVTSAGSFGNPWLLTTSEFLSLSTSRIFL